MSNEMYDSTQDADGAIKIYHLTKSANPGTRGSRFFYEVRDGSGRRLASTTDNKEFVAGIVGRHRVPGTRGFGYSLSLMTQTPANLGSNLTSGGKSGVYGIALIETVNIEGNYFPVHRAANGSLDARNPAVDWSELPKEFRAAFPIEPFYTPRPNDDDPSSIGWVYAGKGSFTDPDEVARTFAAIGSGSRPPAATPKPAPSADIMPPPEVSIAAAFAVYLARETSDGTTTITDVRQIVRARRKLVAELDLYASGLCERFVAAIYEDDDD